MQANQHFSMTFQVDQTPQEVYHAINNVRGWWSQAIEGDTDQLDAIFYYHFQDVHRATFKITELVPNKKVVWHVLDNYFNFIKDKNEWIDTDVVFEIIEKGDKTELRFTHVGLVPPYECFEICSSAWSMYIGGSLRDLITTGRGQPNPIEDIVEQARQMSEQNYTVTLTVDQSPAEVFAAVNNVQGWWSTEIKGNTDKVGAVFSFQAADLHRSTQKITEFVPNKRVVWHVMQGYLSYVNDKTEWTGTNIIFDIEEKDGKSELRFTHAGLTPTVECYTACSDAWGFYIRRSLLDLITTGRGHPDQVTQATPQGMLQ